MSQRRLFIAAFLSAWASFGGHFSGTGPELGRRALSRGVSDASRRCKQCPSRFLKRRGFLSPKRGTGQRNRSKGIGRLHTSHVSPITVPAAYRTSFKPCGAKVLKSSVFDVASRAPTMMAVAATIASTLRRRTLPMALKSRAASVACTSSKAETPPERKARTALICGPVTGPQRNSYQAGAAESNTSPA